MGSRMMYHQPDLSQLNHSLIWDGFRQLIPVSLFVAIFGAAFGLAASQKGIDPTSATMMSLLVFAGYPSITTRATRGSERTMNTSAVTPHAASNTAIFCHPDIISPYRALPVITMTRGSRK